MPMTAAELLLQYVKTHGWYAVANIFHDNEFAHQPHASNGFICASESMEVLFFGDKVDYENSYILEHKYVTSPYHHHDFEMGVSVMPFEHIQRWTALTFTQMHHTNWQGLAEDYPIPTLPTPAEIEAIELDEETGLASGYPIAVMNNRRYTDMKRNNEDDSKWATEISVIDTHPDHPEWSNDKFMGLRIKNIQDFIKNQKMFCERCNTLFGVSDCI